VDADVAATDVEDVAKDVAHVATPSPPPHGIPSPPQEPSLPPQQLHVTPLAPTQEHDNVAQRLEIVKLKARVKKLEQTNKVKSLKFRRLRKVGASRQVESSDDMKDVFNQGRMMNEDEGIELVKDAEIAESEGRQADKHAEIYNIDLDHSSKVLISAVSISIPAASATIPAAKPSILASPTVVAAYTRRRKGVTIRDPEEELPLKTPAETPKVKDKGKGILVEAPKPMKKNDQIEMDAEYARKLHNPQYIKRYQGMKKIPQTESEARKNMMIYLKNTAGFFSDQEIIKSINETPAQKAAKRRKLSEEAQEAEDLRKRLEVVEDEDDDVFVEATPLVQKVPVVDYQIVLIDNKPRWKLLTSCGVHVITLSTVQLFLLVERRYPLSRFTLEQLVNVARLQVEEERLMLSSKSKDCQSDIDAARLKLKLFKNITTAEDITK
nr:hypothetical protein [Tanacetum cinerariifolium]